MTKLKNLIFTLFLATVMSSSLLADNVTLKVIMKNGEENSFLMDANSQITYSASEMYIATADGTVTLLLSDVRKVLFEKTDSVEENLTNTLSVYPNPVKDIIVLAETNENQEVIIYSMTGAEVLRCLVTKNRSIDISSLNDGVYFVKSNNQIVKIIKL